MEFNRKELLDKEGNPVFCAYVRMDDVSNDKRSDFVVLKGVVSFLGDYCDLINRLGVKTISNEIDEIYLDSKLKDIIFKEYKKRKSLSISDAIVILEISDNNFDIGSLN